MDSDVWSVTDFDSYRSDVDEEDCCDSDDRDMLGGFYGFGCLVCYICSGYTKTITPQYS